MTNKRDCENCAHAKPFGGDTDNRCDAWECEFIDRQEAIEAFKARRDDPPIEIVRCGECKHYDKFPTWSACTYWSGDPYEQASVNDDDYCSYGERKE